MGGDGGVEEKRHALKDTAIPDGNPLGLRRSNKNKILIPTHVDAMSHSKEHAAQSHFC